MFVVLTFLGSSSQILLLCHLGKENDTHVRRAVSTQSRDPDEKLSASETSVFSNTGKDDIEWLRSGP